MTKLNKIILLITLSFFNLLQSTLADESTVTYHVTFVNQWNATDHLSFPTNAHFSPIVAVSHSSNYELFSLGKLATTGFESFAEVGTTRPLLREIRQAEMDGNVSDIQVTEPLFPRTDGDVIEFFVTVDKRNPLLSFATMIAPSPDWIVGINGLNTYANGHFIEKARFDLFAINAGTEEGDYPGNFSIDNRATSPQQVISSLSSIPGLNLPFAQVMIERIK